MDQEKCPHPYLSSGGLTPQAVGTGQFYSGLHLKNGERVIVGKGKSVTNELHIPVRPSYTARGTMTMGSPLVVEVRAAGKERSKGPGLASSLPAEVSPPLHLIRQ